MYVKHTTTEGERWDHIALAYYGNPLEFGRIVAANPAVPITATLPGNVDLLIPVLTDADETSASTDDLPPWRR